MTLLRTQNAVAALCWLGLSAAVITAQAQTTTVWNPAANPSGTGLWSEGANWTGATVPDSSYRAVFNVPGAIPCVINNAATISQLVIGDNGPGALTLASGGSLTTGNVWTGIGYNNTGSLTLQSGSSATFGEHLWVGFEPTGIGTLTLSGGTATVSGMFGLGWNGGTGSAEINAGTLNLLQWHPTDSIKGNSILDLSGGQVVITGDRVSSVDAFIAAGKITGYGGSGTVERLFDSDANTTTLVAVVPEPATLGLLSLGLFVAAAGRLWRRTT
ncbi:MAG: PEP-CTERM sorting domain-containing protein [Verrucomicrobia bacterium]|nr:PEP-CTERM sorting domain-containing protein [Verrucomicrobiota bacterium]